MATTPFEPPPRPPVRVNDKGMMEMTPQEYQELLRWLERLVEHIASIT